jgi:dTDP-4-amino-4,6-dideoxygalactose transaminase
MLTYQGRVAIALACQYWGLGPSDEVLVPAYNCGTEVDPLLRSGAKVVLYRVDSRAAVDVQDIQRRATARTRLVYVTHYFGWPQDLRELTGWCRHRGLHLLEDCALSLFSSGPDGPIGSAGDAAVFSFRKTLPVPDGGALVLREAGPAFEPPLRPPRWTRVVRGAFPLVRSYLMRTTDPVGLYPMLRQIARVAFLRGTEPDKGVRRPDMPREYYFDNVSAGWGASRVSRGLMHTVDPDGIVSARRRNYSYLAEALRDVPDVRPLFCDLPEGVCPLALPLLVQERTRWIGELNAKGIPAIPWWAGYHRGLAWDGFPEACGLKDQVLALPVHQGLDGKRLAYIAEVVVGLSKRLVGGRSRTD